MLNLGRFAVTCILFALTAELRAGWRFESRDEVLESRRNRAQQIGLATLQDVRQLSQGEVNRIYGPGLLSDRPAFALRVHFREILRGTPTDKPVDVPFAFIPVPEDPLLPKSNQDREKYLEGRKAIVTVELGEVARQPIVASIWRVESFETDEQVSFWRKATALWNTAKAEDRRALLLAGCRDSLPTFQDYCCRRLANWWDTKPDRNAAEQLERLAALPVIWQRFVDSTAPLDVLVSCEEILGRISPGWKTHPTRYEVTVSAIRRQSRMAAPATDTQADVDRFVKWLPALSRFPGRERQTYRIFDELIGSTPRRYGGLVLTRLADLYRHHALDADQQRLNEEIWNRLVTATAHPDTAPFAADGIYDIARNYAFVGPLPSHVTKELEATRGDLPHSIAVAITSNFDQLRKKLPAHSLAAPLVEHRRKEGHENLTVPTRSQVGKKVVFVSRLGQSPKTDPIFGDSVWSSWHGESLWIERPAQWPTAGTGLIVVTGVLAERHDVPVFRLEADANARFQAGLPVPAGCDIAEIRRRFVVVDCTWQWAK